MSRQMKFADLKHMGRQEKRKLIIETVLKLYAGRSFLEVRIVDVAAAIGVAPATLYNYFGLGSNVGHLASV